MQHKGTTTESQSLVDKETETKLQGIEKAFVQNKEDVVKKILDRVILVTPELHRNLKKVEQ